MVFKGGVRMKILELFCGTKSFSNEAEKLGHQTFTIDNDAIHKPDLCIDIMNFTADMLPEEFKHPDIIWASPPCTTFSVASIRHYWVNGKPKNDKTLLGIALVKKTIAIIEELNPTYWFIENPRGMLRKQDFMPKNRKTVTYCTYGHKVQKPTDIWTNCETWKPLKMCKPGADCHERASRGSKNGIQGINNSFSNLGSRGKIKRAIIPSKLCNEILRSIEDEKT
jgi:site-specific DNA-cytosine methylase